MPNKNHREIPPPAPRAVRLWRNNAYAFLFFLALALLFQWKSSAYHAELAGNSDEPAHVMTGLLVRDYLLGGIPENPVAYGMRYYDHYPKIGFGHWPPVFYLLQAAWLLVLPVSPASLLLLQAVLAALLAVTVFAMRNSADPPLLYLASGALLLSAPMLQLCTRLVLSELLVTLLTFWAALLYGWYLRCPRWLPATVFGVLAGVALLTKGTSVTLAMVPPFAVLLTRRFSLLKKPSFWWPVVLVTGIAAPWYLLVPGARHEAVLGQQGPIMFNMQALTTALPNLAKLAGPATILLLLFALWTMRRRILSQGNEFWPAILGLLPGLLLMRVLIAAASFGERFLIQAMPVIALALPVGIVWLGERWPLRLLSGRGKTLLASAAVLLMIALNVSQASSKQRLGFRDVAAQLIDDSSLAGSVFLVSSDANGEGAFVTEIALRERRPGHRILRASKVLCNESWNGRGYRARWETAREVLDYLTAIPVGVLVLDETPGLMRNHDRQLQAVLRENQNLWERIPVNSKNGVRQVGVYRQKGHENRKVNEHLARQTPRIKW